MSVAPYVEALYDQIVVKPDEPGAGNNLVVNVPGHVEWRLLSGVFSVTTDATVANRLVFIQGDDGTEEYFAIGAAVFQPASRTFVYHFSRLLGTAYTSPSGDVIFLPLGDLVLQAGHRLLVTVLNLAAGDAIAGIKLSVLQRTRRVDPLPFVRDELVDPRVGEFAFVE